MKQFLKSNISRLVRFAAREAGPELSVRIDVDDLLAQLDESRLEILREKLGNLEGRTKIDMFDAVSQLTTKTTDLELRRFYAWNHRWVALLSERNRRTASHTYDFIDAKMQDATFLLDQFQYIARHKDEIELADKSILDLGVYKGASTRQLAKIFPENTIHGFDSFEGLPEDWTHALQDDFGDVAGKLPNVPGNVRLYKGWFEDSLPAWREENANQPIGILRVDCDIYSSTKTILDVLGDLLVSGTWIVFDELIGYRGWQHHEYKAFSEYLEHTPFEVEYLAYGLTYTIVRLK